MGWPLTLPGFIWTERPAGAGHSKEIAKRLTTGRLISLDQDPDAVATAAARLKGLPAQVVQANFRETARVLDELEIPFINGALLDLGRFQPPAWTMPSVASPITRMPRWICA